ncbi:MAG: CRISPR-associated endonuclease Cas1 [Methylococcales bacterium]
MEIHYENLETHRVGLQALRHIIVHTDAQLSASLLRSCNEAGVSILLAAGRGRGATAHLFPSRETTRLRHAQHRSYADSARRLNIARALVKAKIDQQVQCLKAHGEDSQSVSRFIDQAECAPGINELMGVEGAAAARYFTIWAKLWHKPWHFPGRNRRPPRDPVNALMSLGQAPYSLALNHVGRRAALCGLDFYWASCTARFPTDPRSLSIFWDRFGLGLTNGFGACSKAAR